MPQEKRAGVLLTLADRANGTLLRKNSQTFRVCDQAIRQCRAWLDGKHVSAHALAEYLDAEEGENPWMQESVFSGDAEGLHALVFVTMIIGHIAHLAYLKVDESGRMSEVIAEAGENLLEHIAEYGDVYRSAEQ